jgi:hypothetical protein
LERCATAPLSESRAKDLASRQLSTSRPKAELPFRTMSVLDKHFGLIGFSNTALMMAE